MLGLANYYRRFIPGFANIAASLHRLVRQKIKFKLEEVCEIAFGLLKEKLVAPPVLAYPQFDKEFVLVTDASGEALGAVLEQEGRPV